MITARKILDLSQWWFRENIFLKDVLLLDQSLVTLITDVTFLGCEEEARQNSTIQLVQKKGQNPYEYSKYEGISSVFSDIEERMESKLCTDLIR